MVQGHPRRQYPRRLSAWLATALAVLAFGDVLAPAPSHADIVLFRTVLTAVRQAHNRARELREDVEYVEKTLTDIRDNKPPQTRGSSRWKDLVKNYNDLDASINALSVRPVFDDAQFAISPDRILACDTRNAEIARGRSLVDALNAAIHDGEDIAGELEALDKDASGASDALVEAMKLYDKLVSTPLIGEQFQWDWFDLNTKVTRALGNVRSSARAKRRELIQQRAVLVQRRGNLSANLDSLSHGDCKAVYRGCYRDQGSLTSAQGRDLNGQMYVDAAGMKPSRCMVTCKANGYTYAGLQFGKQCFCGNAMGRFGGAGNCNFHCTGAPSEICGGDWANSVYQVSP